MLGILKKTCMFCNGVTTKGFRTPDHLKGFVCGQCYQRWIDTGRNCTACGAPVSGMQEVGVFIHHQRMLGHAACGGLRLFG